MGRRLRAGVAGLGFGARVHAPVLARLPDVEVVAICGTDAQRTQDAAMRLGTRGYTDLHAFLDQRLDVVSLALPPAVNSGFAQACFARGLPVLCEKPVALTTAAARSLLDAAPTTTAVDFEFAEAPVFHWLLQAAADGRWGQVEDVHVTWTTLSFAQERCEWSWKTDEARGGGVLPLLGSHVLHMLEALVGRVATITADVDRRRTSRFAPPGALPAADGATLALTTEAGARSTVVLSNAAHGAQRHEWRVLFERATVTLRNDGLDPLRGFQLVVRRPGRPDEVLQPDDGGSEDGRIPAFETLARRFVTAVREGTPASPDIGSGVRVQELLDGTMTAAASRCGVDVRGNNSAA